MMNNDRILMLGTGSNPDCSATATVSPGAAALTHTVSFNATVADPSRWSSNTCPLSGRAQARVGVEVGVPLAAATVAVALWALRERRLRRQAERRNNGYTQDIGGIANDPK